MKNKNDTWLGFFKKTLKVSGLVLLGIIVLIGIGLYFSFKNDSYTYLSCTETDEDQKQYIAFNDSRLLTIWDPLEEEFKQNLKLIEFNKKTIKAVFYFVQKDTDNKSISILEREPFGLAPEQVLEGYINLNRETGEYQLSFEDRGMVGNKEACTKIKKSDLPVTKVNQKF
jgi:hypothetical protein